MFICANNCSLNLDFYKPLLSVLAQGLKQNWEELQKEFQLLPMVTDTVPKIKRKVQLEKRLKELEKDIDLIERNPIIYVAYDQESVRDGYT